MIIEINTTDDANQIAAPCRICSRVGLNSILPLGGSAEAQSAAVATSDARWSLDLAWCPSCSLAQITESIPTDILTRESALPASAMAGVVLQAKSVVEQVCEKLELGPESLAIEIASNDGYLLQWYQQAKIPVLGIEAAQDVAWIAESKHGIGSFPDRFGLEFALQLKREGHCADVIHANHVLGHVADLNDVVAGFAALLKPEGMAVVEVPYLKDLLDEANFDTINHDHLCFFSLSSLRQLFGQHGMEIVDVERSTLSTGTMRVFAAKTGAWPVQSSVRDLMDQEATWVRDSAQYLAFSNRIQSLRQELGQLLQTLKSEGKRIAVYGGSAKGNTLLESFGIGSHLKIYDPVQLVEDQPDYCLLLATDGAAEILSEQHRYREMGGRFIIPTPTVRIA